MKTLLIMGDANPTADMLDRARGHALRAYRLVCTGWRVVVADGHTIDLKVAQTCAAWKMEYLVCGVAKNPRNGTSRKHYHQVQTTAEGWRARYAQRDAFMIGLADTVVCIGVTPETHAFYQSALLAGKIAYLGSGQRQPERRNDGLVVADRA